MITKRHFGYTSAGKAVSLYCLKSKGGGIAEIMDYGATIVSLSVPDNQNRLVDVVLGYDSLAGYEAGEKYVGATVGRYCNRIAKGRITLKGKKYQLSQNDGKNHLHGGIEGFDKKLWQSRIIGDSLELTYFSANGEEGYPGNLKATVTYSFDNANGLLIDYQAVCDQDTVVSLTNHTYFNLDGYEGGDIANHLVQIYSDSFTPADRESIPTGEILPVEGTPMDFREWRSIGQGIDEEYEPLQFAKGYDHNWCLKPSGDAPALAAAAQSQRTGITLSVFTTMPGIQFYTGNYLEGAGMGKKQIPIIDRSGFCLETQFYPNSPSINHFPSPLLKKGERFHHQTIFRFHSQ